MDVNGMRMKNYKRLLREFQESPGQAELPHHGLIKRFSERVGVSDRYLSHINNGRKDIGAKTARSIENGFDKPHGWLDNDNDAPLQSESDTEKEIIATVISLYRENPDGVHQMLMRYMREKIVPKK
ncbi:MAG: helix-turn-helix domain-containing protein [Rhodoferax sp.]